MLCCIAAGQCTPPNLGGPLSVPPGSGVTTRAALAELGTAEAQPSAYRATEVVKAGHAGSRLARAATPAHQVVLPNAAEAVKTRHARAASLPPIPAHTISAAAAASVPGPARRSHTAAAAEAAPEGEAGDGHQEDVTHPDDEAVGGKAAAVRIGAAANNDSGKESNSHGSRLQRRALAKAGPNAAQQGVY